MCLSYLSVLSQFLFSCNHVFFQWVVGWGTGKQVGPTFFYLLLLFLKNALLSLLFYSKMSFTHKNPEFFSRSLRSLGFKKLTYDFFFSGSTLQNIKFLVLTPKGSLFSLYYCHSYYPAYLVWNLFLTTQCDKFCTWKSPTIPTFLTPIIHTFLLLFPNFYRYFFPTFLWKGT